MTLLLLAGTNEAKRIAQALAADHDVQVLASLAGVTRHPASLPVPTRVGGFGGEYGFRNELKTRSIHAVLDATHPFANIITDRTARICNEMHMPYAQVLRPEWVADKGDNWTHIASPADAANHLPADARVFLATGRQELCQYQNLNVHRTMVRVIDPPSETLPFEGGEFIIGRPPFTVESEIELFRKLEVTHLVVKNAGGTGGRPKLDAARALGLPVLMIRRPPMPDVHRLETVQDAVSWATHL